MFADPTRGFAPVPSKLADQPFVITTKKCPLEFTQKMSTKIHLIRRMFILNLISYTSPNLEIVTDWYIQLAFLYIALWKHDFKYLPTYSIALYKKNKKGWIFAHLHIEILNERVWGKFSFRKDDLSQPLWPSKGNEALSSSLN